jgi:hypothetical protein
MKENFILEKKKITLYLAKYFDVMQISHKIQVSRSVLIIVILDR